MGNLWSCNAHVNSILRICCCLIFFGLTTQAMHNEVARISAEYSARVSDVSAAVEFQRRIVDSTIIPTFFLYNAKAVENYE